MSDTYSAVGSIYRDIWPQGKGSERRFVQRAAELAYNVINAFLAVRYSVPFSAPVPPLVVDISDILTRVVAQFIVNHGRYPREGEIEKEAGLLSPMGMLEKLAAGEMELPGVAESSDAGPWLSTEDRMRIFDLDSEYDQGADPGHLEDVADERDAAR